MKANTHNHIEQAASEPLPPGIAEHKQVDYQNLDNLTAALDGVGVVLSFILPFADKDNVAQKNLIDACIKAGVRRFAPSEWALYVQSSWESSTLPANKMPALPTRRIRFTKCGTKSANISNL